MLHIACLPFHFTHVDIFVRSIYLPSHKYRALPWVECIGYIEADGAGDPQLEPQLTDCFGAQRELVIYLTSSLDAVEAILAKQDYHGNTAMHYMAMHKQ